MFKKWLLMIAAGVLTFLNLLLLLAILIKLFIKQECPGSTRHLTGYQMERIVGGRSVKIDDFRFIAAIVILVNGIHLQCGASVVSAHWVISAAHCVELMENIPIEYIYISACHKEWKKGTKHKVTKMIMNERFNKLTLVNDTALLKVKQAFNMQAEMPITLPNPSYSYVVNSTASIIGWGFNSSESKVIRRKLYAVQVMIFSPDYCSILYGDDAPTEDMFCAGSYIGGKDACQFDSGGPIVQENILIGIISWGGDCGDKTHPGVYAKLSYFIPWIKEVEKRERTKIVLHILRSNNERVRKKGYIR